MLTDKEIAYHREEYNRGVQRINQMTPREFHLLMLQGKCPVPVEHLLGVPLGMFHCELCGTMVVAGLPHGPPDPPWHPQKSLAAQYFYECHPELLEEFNVHTTQKPD